MLKKLLVTASLFGAIAAQTHADVSAFNDKMHSVTVGAEVAAQRYKIGNDKSTGGLGGFDLGYRFLASNKFFLNTDLGINFGRVDGYKTIDFEIRQLAGMHFYPSETLSIAPFLGLAYDRAKIKINDDEDVTFTESFVYLPVGMRAEKKLNSSWSMSAQGEFDFVLKKKYEFSAGDESISNTKRSGHGIRGEVLAHKKLNSGTISFGPFVKHWDHGRALNATKTIYGAKVKYTF